MRTSSSKPAGLEVRGPLEGRTAEILTPEALELVAELEARFGSRREELLRRRTRRRAAIEAGVLPGFLEETRTIREADWQVAPPPPDLVERQVEITGPVDRKLMINALNSGASAFMADLEDASSPTWANCIGGQANLLDAVERTIELRTDEKTYRLNERTATLLVRPRGWHLVEKHVAIGDSPVSASLFDAGLFLFHCARRLLDRGSGPYLYLPKLENHLEARLWNDVLTAAEERLGLPRDSVRTTVLIETILAAFEMEEILWELRERSTGLNAGRWDYIFSVIKNFRERPDFLLPDRAQIAMTVPFMRAYTELLVRTCHRRRAHAIGGMAAFIPSRRDPEVNETALAKVREDKVRETSDGFDGTWVAHPDLVPVAREEFRRVLGDRPNQVDRRRDDVAVVPADLLDVTVPDGRITEAGLRQNASVGLRYLDSWLHGVGAAAIFNLMEDAATAEISRSQIWQWARHAAKLDDGRAVTEELVRDVVREERAQIESDRADDAHAIFERVALERPLIEFLTVPAYEYID
jgi:malate synthase